MAEHQLPKLDTGVRFSSPAPLEAQVSPDFRRLGRYESPSSGQRRCSTSNRIPQRFFTCHDGVTPAHGGRVRESGRVGLADDLEAGSLGFFWPLEPDSRLDLEADPLRGYLRAQGQWASLEVLEENVREAWLREHQPSTLQQSGSCSAIQSFCSRCDRLASLTTSGALGHPSNGTRPARSSPVCHLTAS